LSDQEIGYHQQKINFEQVVLAINMIVTVKRGCDQAIFRIISPVSSSAFCHCPDASKSRSFV
jgi:hypothetical protein